MPLKLKRSGRYGADKLFTAHIKLLDNIIIDINLPLSSKGKDCLEKIANKLGLREIDYFGLQFLTKKEKLRWVELDKCLRKQLDRYAAHKGRDALLVFKVQFFAVTLETLKQEITRYLYYLQLKSHVLHGKLKCDISLCLKLAGLAVQAEFGDHDPSIHSIDYLNDFHLLPNELLNTTNTNIIALNKEILEAHKQSQGLDPASAERKYIELCLQLEHYGIEYFDGRDKENIPIQIGSSYQGIKLVYLNKEKSSSLLRWEDVGKMAFNRQQFVVVSIKTGETLYMQMDDMETSKYLWKLCVGQHQFFRMSRNTIGKNAFRTQFEVTTDSEMFIKMHQKTPQINRRVTLTKRKAKETKSIISDTSSVGSNSLVEAVNDVIPYPYVDDSLDDTEFLHRYEDMCNLGRDTRDSSFTSSGSTNASNASSEYTTSDSDSEADHRQFFVQPMFLNGPMETRPVSLIFTRLSKIENEHRDELLKHLQRIRESGEWQTEFDQVFRKKNVADFTTAIENTAGNRVNDVLPYEDNRIHLNPNNNFEATSYINASSIKISVGNNQKNLSFLVAQSPLKHTVNNFWQMIWEHNVTVVAVLSKLEENGSEACWQYWPNDSNEKNIATFGQVTVRKRFDNNFTSYAIRSLHVQHASDRRSRTVFQLQFLQWPEDNSVPRTTKPFIEYLDEIQSIRKVAKDMNRHLPHQETLIHCEDGAGRSGVVVLAEVLLASIEQNESLDVPMTLAHLRSQRTHFVQTSHQYKFVYQLLIDYLKRNRLI